MDTIYFYKIEEEFGFLSNFSHFGFFIDNNYWYSVEHFYQASKFLDPKLQQTIQNLKTPREAAIMGKDLNNPLRENWDEIKEDIMRFAIRQKFEQNATLKYKLMQTNDRFLCKHKDKDPYWADGENNTGLNRLGYLLMELRESFQENN